MADENIIKKYEAQGVLDRRSDGYWCKICNVSLGIQVEPHMIGKQHKRNVFNEVFGNKTKFPSLYANLSPAIREADKKGHIEKDGQAIKCKVCQDSVTGQEPLQAHLDGKSHKNKVALKGTPGVATGAAASGSTYDSGSSATPVVTSDNSLIADAIARRTVREIIGGLPDHYHCEVCDLDVTGKIPLKDHLNGSKHKKKVLIGGLKASPATPTFPPPQLASPADTVSVASVTSPLVSMTFNMSGGAQSFPQFPMQYPVMPTQYPPGGCIPPHYVGAVPLYQPYMAPVYPDQPYGVPQQVDGQRIGVNSPPIGTSASPPDYRMKANASGSQPLQPYPLNKESRGVVCIFNYIKFKDNQQDERQGAEKDTENIQKVFKQMNYIVEVYHDFSKKQTFQQLEKIREWLNVSNNSDSLIMFFLSHGEDQDQFYSSDCELINHNNIIDEFVDSKCEGLKHKPKIFMFNYCRGPYAQMFRPQFDGAGQEEREIAQDTTVVQAAHTGIKAVRIPQTGTIFVSCLCEILCEHASTKHLYEIIPMTSDLMQLKGATTATALTINFRKPFYFMGSGDRQ